MNRRSISGLEPEMPVTDVKECNQRAMPHSAAGWITPYISHTPNLCVYLPLPPYLPRGTALCAEMMKYLKHMKWEHKKKTKFMDEKTLRVFKIFPTGRSLWTSIEKYKENKIHTIRLQILNRAATREIQWGKSERLKNAVKKLTHPPISFILPNN